MQTQGLPANHGDAMTSTASNNAVASNSDVDMLFNEFLQNHGNESDEQTFSFLLDTLEKTLQADVNQDGDKSQVNSPLIEKEGDVDMLEVADAVSHGFRQPDTTGGNNNKVVRQANQTATQTIVDAPVVNDEPIVIDDDCYIESASDSVIIID